MVVVAVMNSYKNFWVVLILKLVVADIGFFLTKFHTAAIPRRNPMRWRRVARIMEGMVHQNHFI